VAALTVVLNHFHELWFPQDLHLPQTGLRETVEYALHFIDGGHEAVILFFLLSGFVLALPYNAGRAQSFPVFLVRRIVRIYGPYFIALCGAVGCAAIWHGDLHRGRWASEIWALPPSVSLTLQHVLFLGVYDYHPYNPVFWSLIYEMRISVLFPVIVLVVGRLKTWTSVSLALGLSATTMFLISRSLDSVWVPNLSMTLHYSGVFIVGILLSTTHERLGALYNASSRFLRYAIAVAAIVIYRESTRVSDEALTHLLRPASLHIVSDWLVVIGASAAIIGALHSETFQELLSFPSARFLGKISYSLYLVHLPILLAMAFTIGYRLPMLAQLALYLVASLSLATMFYYCVEAPFTQLSRYAGNSLGRRSSVERPVNA